MAFLETLNNIVRMAGGRKSAAAAGVYNSEITVPPLGHWPQYAELLDAPHVLLAGSTGSGKSTALHGMIYTLTALKRPYNARLVLIDPKRVELRRWAVTPFCSGYADSPETIVLQLEKSADLMESRYQKMQNQNITQSTEAAVYIIIDELADLMLNADIRIPVERVLRHIACLGRAANIRLWVGTQVPSRRVLTAPIMVGFTHKIGLRVDTQIESRQVIAVKGCELLPEHGQAIMRSPHGLTELNIPLTPPQDIADRIAFWGKYR